MIRAIILATAIATQASANVQCGDRAVVLIQLAERYQEARTGAGLTANGVLVEIFAAPSGSWTILTTTPDMQTCLVASGHAWEEANDPPAPLGVPG